jgi:hypothetical protein
MKRSPPSIFISYSHADKPFVQRLVADLKVSGANAWIDEAELRIGDSLLTKIQSAIDRTDYLAAVLSPNSVSSRWVQEELQQALHLQIGGKPLTVLPILLAECDIPGFLRARLYADFRDKEQYEGSLEALLRSIGIENVATVGAMLLDPLAARYDRVAGFYARPRTWFCVRCGARVPEKWGYSSPVCPACNAFRPYIDADTTIEQCTGCRQLNISGAKYCEWCGAEMPKFVA